MCKSVFQKRLNVGHKRSLTVDAEKMYQFSLVFAQHITL